MAGLLSALLTVGALGGALASVRSVADNAISGSKGAEGARRAGSPWAHYPLQNASSQHAQQHQQKFQSEGWEADGASVSDWQSFRKLGHDMIDYVADYYTRVEEFPVGAQVKPGYLKKRLVAQDFPLKGETFSSIMADMENHVMPGITHWQHPSFFGYFPSMTSPPSILGNLLASMLTVVSFSWEASPAATELEIMVVDQLARALGLPDVFQSTGEGGGVILSSASETTLIGMLAARTKALKHLRRRNPGSSDQELFAKMTFYTSDQAHSSIIKTAGIVGLGANLRLVPTERANDYAMDIDALAEAMRVDRARGLMPTFVAGNVGTTNSCAVDPVRAMGEVCQSCPEGKEDDFLAPWLHIDAAYAGTAAICPENRWIFDGVDAVDSLGTSIHKGLFINWSCAVMWAKRSADIRDALSLTPPYLISEEYRQGEVTDLKDWQLSLGRDSSSLKLWFTMRAYGLDKLRAFIRNRTKLGELMETLVNQDDRFEIMAPTRFGLATFRLKASDAANEELRKRILASGKAWFSSTVLDGRTCFRIAIGGLMTEERHIVKLWDTMTQVAGDVLDGTPRS